MLLWVSDILPCFGQAAAKMASLWNVTADA